MRNRQERDNVIFWLILMLILFFIGAKILKGMPNEAKDVEENLIADEIEEAIEDAAEIAKIKPQNNFYLSECKLSKELQNTIYETCNDTGIPYNIAFGLIEVESSFDENALNKKTGCYGLCQLNPRYFPSGLTPAENIKTGINWLWQLYSDSGDMAKALTIYNVGHDNGTRTYAARVLKAAEKWG